MNNVCNRCGGTSFHYNRSKMRMVCDCCMMPVYDASLDQQLMQYDQSYSRAEQHLTAGNWQEVIRIINPLMNQYPTDKKLYIAVLRAATKDYSDIEMAEDSVRSDASNAWNKLVRLNGINSDMRAYSRRRYEKHRKELLSRRNIILFWLLGGGLGCITGGILFSSSHYLLFVLALTAGGYCLYRFFISKPYQVFKQLLSSKPNYTDNPFL